ncbi:hypothetical protein DPJ78_04020 [Salmonella enterica subsp. enterica serovar Panama]|nr:hypothetical protein [Salmonella enterica subsp. enterica serovar Panama]EBW6120265.1 hypothetical protein [Salmonella enterica subsp. enterica serovar Panama]
MKEHGITDGLTMNQLAERNAEHVATIAALAAENAGLKAAIDSTIGWQQSTDPVNVESVRMLVDIETPATDAFLAEVRASARNEGINYAASRLAAAFNHGFLNKPVSEVLDVTRMILSAKEDLSNDPLPADDGLSGEYAEKSIEEWAAQLRKGVQS